MSRRFPLAVRLSAVLSVVAAIAAALALAAQDFGLRGDLEEGARSRLEGSARSADHLVAEALRDFALRQSGVSRTPEFRAHLELRHLRTLERFAADLAERTDSSVVVFLDAAGTPIAGFGPVEAQRLLARAWAGDLARNGSSCVAGGSHAPPAWTPCRPGSEDVQATLARVADEGWLSAVVPLRRGRRNLGLLVAGQPLSGSVLANWSDLAGATLVIETGDAVPATPLHREVRRFDGLVLHAASTFEREAAALARARRNLLGAGAVAVLLSALLSTLLAPGLVRPIRQIQRATERIGEGDLDVRLSIRRGDEIGDVAAAFDATLERLRESQDRLGRVQRMACFGDWSFDPVTGRVDGSPEFHRLLGLAPSMAPLSAGQLVAAFDAADRERLREALYACHTRGETLQLELRLPAPGGSRVMELRGHPVEGTANLRVEASIHDVTERRRSEEQIRFLAYRDSLTGLANRRRLTERLEQAVSREDAAPFALVFVDLDRFKLVNDTLGHAAGDELLREVASRLRDVVGETDVALVARMGGDEFTLLVADPGDGSQADATARAILAALARPFLLQGQEVVVTATLGLSLWPKDGPAAGDLVRGCDTALHQAKLEGRNAFRVFDVAMREAAQHRWQLEHRLRAAIDEGRLALHFQPRVDARTSRVRGFEALLRWTDEELGTVSPESFVALAEETGLILPLGDWVMRTAIEQLRIWRAEGLDVGKISINLSGRQLRPELVGRVRTLFESSGVEPGCVEFEVTESAVMDDEEIGVAALSDLRAMGFRVSLDDFGTGFSSLSVLRRLPIDGLKIDRAFIRDITTEPRDADLAASIIALARILELFVVVEGVETAEQRDLLREMGCDEMQGFLFGGAVPPELAPELVRDRRRRKRWR